MAVIITSFKESDNILRTYRDVTPYSVSRWQPKGYFYETLIELAAYDIHGNRLHLKGSSLDGYKDEWLAYIRSNITWLNKWLTSLDPYDNILLSCWCPHSNATRRQMKQYKTFVCHTGLIGRVINKFRPDMPVFMDQEHHESLIPEWKPENYKVLGAKS